MKLTAGAAFWVFMSVFLVCTWLYWRGHDTFFWKHKTEAEIADQRKKLGL
jgi:hypothetical protein